MKQFGNHPPLPLSTNPPISEQYFRNHPLCPNFNEMRPPPPLPPQEETMNDHCDQWLFQEIFFLYYFYFLETFLNDLELVLLESKHIYQT